jgi:hypothetical protein
VSKSPVRRQYLISEKGSLFEYLYSQQESKKQNMRKIEHRLKEEEEQFLRNKPVFVSGRTN